MKKYFLLILILGSACLQADAQMKAGDKKFDKMAYAAAITRYERAVKKNDESVDAWTRLADSYRLVGDYVNAERAYSRIVNGPVQQEVYLHYAQALMQNEKYGEAKSWLEKYRAANPGDNRAANLLAGIEQLPQYKSMEGVYKVAKANVNTSASEMAPVIYNGGIVYASNKALTGWVKRRHAWNGKPFYQLYFAKGTDGNLQSPKAFAEDVETKLHDGPVTFSKAGTQMYFTRNNIEDDKIQKDSKGVVRLKIFHSNYADGDWGIEVPFAYNSNDHSCAHPSLSADGKTLYFSSDMPGGQGGMDIWKCEWNGTAWGAPINLGADVNTKGHEVFPSITSDGVLYYSSDGLAGMGGLDMYSADVAKGGKPQNLGFPMNSAADDFGITWNATNDNGYFSSNRKNSHDNDDIYFFTKKCVTVEVVVKDETTQELLPNTKVVVYENGTEHQVMETDSSAKFTTCLNPLRNYDFVVQRDNYTENKASITNSDLAAASAAGSKQVEVVLKKNIANVKGRVFNSDTKEGKANVPVRLINRTTKEDVVVNTDENGYFKFDNVALDSDYEVRTSFKDCGEAKEQFSTYKISGVKDININLALLCKGAIIEIENIYYDYNSAEIRADAALELDKVVALMNEHTTMKIEIRSHTDSRGKDNYNLTLSDKRAKAAVAYVVSKGIDAARVTGKGYGETQLLNHCKNNVECSEEEHAVNRRTEFKILEM
jgi:outer membrane protein OmpA-like peptidoglycan-associated protein